MITKLPSTECKSINVLSKEKCYSCRSCEQICPQNAIKMTKNIEGFIYPYVTEECNNCGLCVKRCPSLNPVILSEESNICYGGYINDATVLAKSTSGGFFYGIAKKFIEENGVVFGSAYGINFDVLHIKVNNISELSKLQGSKYVVSDTLHTYSEAKKLLDRGTKVLYSGTPCQIAGLRKFLDKNYHNLFTIDLICHGVPSETLFKKYIDWLEVKNKIKIKDYSFRAKEYNGWTYTAKVISSDNRILKIVPISDPYYASFLRGDTYRESCYTCQFARKERVGDITIGDFWGVEKSCPDLCNNNGVSCVIINSSKGNELFIKLGNDFTYKTVSFNDISQFNHNLSDVSKRPSIRSVIYKDMNNCETLQFFSRFNESKFLCRIFIKFKQKLPMRIKTLIRGVVKL